MKAEAIINVHNPHSAFTSKGKPVPMGNPTPPLKIQHLSQEKMEDRKQKGLCYNCDEKYVKGHRFQEQKIFHMDANSSPVFEDLGQEEPSEDEDTEQPFPVQ